MVEGKKVLAPQLHNIQQHLNTLQRSNEFHYNLEKTVELL